MKLIVDSLIGIKKEDVDTSILKNFSVSYFVSSSKHIIIKEQKINLDEKDMNILFYHIFSEAKDTIISYSPLGAEGCEFSMRIRQ